MSREKFFVFGLPRSRTTWLSIFLTTPTCKVIHDVMEYPSVEAILAGDFDGVCDTGLVLFWNKFPKERTILIERDYNEIKEDMKKYCGEEEPIGQAKAKEAFQEAKKTLTTYQFQELKKESVCKELFELLTEEPFDKERWQELDKVRLQPDLQVEIERANKNMDNIKSLYGDILWQSGQQ